MPKTVGDRHHEHPRRWCGLSGGQAGLSGVDCEQRAADHNAGSETANREQKTTERQKYCSCFASTIGA